VGRNSTGVARRYTNNILYVNGIANDDQNRSATNVIISSISKSSLNKSTINTSIRMATVEVQLNSCNENKI